MNEIEKMYKNAKIEKQYCPSKEVNDKCTGTLDCLECPHAIYPPFTAEKQLELIKWLCANTNNTLCISTFNNTFIVAIGIKPEIFFGGNTIGEAIAELVSHLWQSLTSKEKQQIKRILE